MALVFASHDFEEAVFLADRVIVLARDSPRIRMELPVQLGWPREPSQKNLPEFRSCLEEIIKELV